MPGKYGSPSAFFRCDGYNMLSMKLQSFRHKETSITEEASGVGDTYEIQSPTGMSKVEVSQGGGFFDTSTNGGHAALVTSLPSSPQATPRIVCFGYVTEAVGSLFTGIQGAFTATYEVLAQVGKLTKANTDYVVSGQVDHGQVIQPLATKTADWNTKTLATTVDYTTDPSQRVIPITSATKANPCVVTTTVPHGLTTGQIILVADNTLTGTTINVSQTVTVVSTTTFSNGINTSGSGGAGTGGTLVRASTVNGGAGYQQITAFSGFTGFVGKIRDSADDTTYADLVTFTNVTAAPSAERGTVSGTVDRYICYDGNVTGSGSIDAFAGFARGLPL